MKDSDVSMCVAFMERAFPEPKTKNLHTQIGVHFEEIREMVQVLEKSALDQKTLFIVNMLAQALKACEIHFKNGDNLVDIKPGMREEMLDGICDQLVTATGIGYMLRMDVAGGFGEVNRSNFSKFDENGKPIYDQNQKMIKGPNYFKPNLAQYI